MFKESPSTSLSLAKTLMVTGLFSAVEARSSWATGESLTLVIVTVTEAGEESTVPSFTLKLKISAPAASD